MNLNPGILYKVRTGTIILSIIVPGSNIENNKAKLFQSILYEMRYLRCQTFFVLLKIPDFWFILIISKKIHTNILLVWYFYAKITGIIQNCRRSTCL